MSNGWERINIFISSTFDDMHAERDYLVKRVIPQLQEWCEERQLQLVDIDLRWGVTEQAATQERNVVKKCLQAIDACRPFFLGFLGQRRGWVPRADDISAETVEAYPGIGPYLGSAAVTELEIAHAVVRPLDREALPERPTDEHAGRSPCSFFYLRDPGYLSQLPVDPAELRKIYTNDGIPDPDERRRHDQAAERSRALARARGAAVHAYAGSWNADATTPEVMLPLDCPFLDPSQVAAWRRRWSAAGVEVDGASIQDPVAIAAARAYNARLAAGRLTGFTSDDRQLSDTILDDLRTAIVERYPGHVARAPRSALERELDQQGQFLLRVTEGFVERAGSYAALDAYVDGDDARLLALTAAGGLGKTTLLANWIEHRRASAARRPEEDVHVRFIGASDQSTTIDQLLASLLDEISEGGRAARTELPDDPARLREVWMPLLTELGEGRRTVIVLDGINQLETGLADLDWLPWTLPPDIRLVVSFKTDDPAGADLRRRMAGGGEVALLDLSPFDDRSARRRLVAEYLSGYLKELDEQLTETLIRAPAAGNPLYLKVVLAELRVFGSYGALKGQLESSFGNDPVSAFHQVLRRLETDTAYAAVEPDQVALLLFGLLAHARMGLSVAELSALFMRALGFDGDSGRQQAVEDAVHLLLRQVRPYLARRQGRFDFLFESFRTAAAARYTRTASPETGLVRTPADWHRLLAAYFDGLPLWYEPDRSLPDGPRVSVGLRKVSELPHHLLESEQWDRLAEVLCDLRFIEAKCAAGMTYELLGDFRKAMERSPRRPRETHAPWLRRVTPFYRFVQAESHNLARYASTPGFTLQQAHNYAASGPVLDACARLWDSQPGARPDAWLRRLDRPADEPLLVAAMERHAKGVTDCAFFPEGDRLVSSSMDGSVIVWHATTWHSLEKLTQLDGSIDTCDVSPDGSRIVSGCSDGQVRLHDSDTRHTIVCEGKFEQSPRRCRFFPDGERVLSVGHRGLMIHEVATGKLLQSLDENLTINDCAFAPTGLVALACAGAKVHLYDPARNQLVERLYLHRDEGSAYSCRFSPDGSRLLGVGGKLFYSDDVGPLGQNSLWSTPGFQEQDPHDRKFSVAATACTFFPDGQSYAIGLLDGSLEVFDSASGERAIVVGGHSKTIRSLRLSPDGDVLVSASLDGRLKAWNSTSFRHGAGPGEPTGRGHFCSFADHGERAVVWTGRQVEGRGLEYDFFRRDYEVRPPLAVQSSSAKLHLDPEPTFTLNLHRRDTMTPLTAVSVSLSGLGAAAPHRTAPIQHAGRHWLLASSARMFPFEFHLVPAIPPSLWSGENVTWASSADGQMCAVVQRGRLQVWRLTSPPSEVVSADFPREEHTYHLPQCGFSQDGRRVFLISARALSAVDLADGGVRRWSGDGGNLAAFCESPGGERVLAAGQDGSLYLWRMDGSEAPVRFAGHDGEAVDCGFIDEDTPVSIGSVGSLRVWSTRSHRQLAVFAGETSMAAFALSPSGKEIVAAGIGGQAYILQLSDSEL